MEYESIKSLEGTSCKITLLNDFWYRATIISVSEHSVKFIEERGREVVVTPEQIAMILPSNNMGNIYNG